MCMYVCAPHVCSPWRDQRKALDPVGLELHMVMSHRCWESNSSPLEEQLVLLTMESPCHPHPYPIFLMYTYFQTITREAKILTILVY